MKIWNSAADRANFTMTLVTENLDCYDKSLKIYAEQDVPDNYGNVFPEKKLHFLGGYKMIPLERISINNGLNQCVFKHICVQMCYYVFIFVDNAPDQNVPKICEVQFN